MIEGTRLPVAEVSLRGGQVVFQCMLQGPVTAVDGGAVTIFGEDGLGICQGYCEEVRWKDVALGEVLMVYVAMRMDSCYGSAEAQPAESPQQ